MKWNDRIGRRIKLHDLHILLTVAELGSMGKAAERLAISQPSISKAIADLEHTIGVRLLDRTPGGALATAYGRALIERGIGAFDELRLGMRDIEHLADPTIGEVRVGAPDAISAGLLCEVVDRFSLSNPRVTVNIVAANNMFPEYRLLRDRHVDFLLGGLTTPFAVEGLEAERLYSEQVFIVAGSKNKFARRRKLGLADLIDESWLLPLENIFSAHMVEAFRLSGLSLPAGGVKPGSVTSR